jgi:hypothetical protein
MEIEKSQSLSRVSSRSSKKKVSELVSDDISMSQLELLANKKKLNKKSEEISLDNVQTENKGKFKESVDSSKPVIKSISDKSSTKRTSTVDSTSSDYAERKRYERKKVNKENKDEAIRKEKSEILFKLYTIVEKSNGRWSCKMDMNNTLDEIKNEFSRIKATLDNEAMVKFCKHGLVMGIKGIEMLNGAYDPIGVDLDGWSEAMSYNMATTEYDEVLAELCEKYKGTGSMSPEVKLILMIVMSGAMFSFSKKATKDPNTLTNLMSAFMKKSQSPAQQPKFQQQPEFQQQQRQPEFQQQQRRQQPEFQQQQRRQQPEFQQHESLPQQFLETRGFNPQSQGASMAGFAQVTRVPSMTELNRQRQQDVDTEDSDNIPSKIRGPSFDSPDSANIEQIIQTMKEKNKKKEQEIKIRPDIEQILNETDTSEDKKIVPNKTRGKGRPKKNVSKAQGRNA